jgi:hypothetical protein
VGRATKARLVVVKLITIEKFSKKKLNYIPYAHLLCCVGYVNVELIKHKNWNFFAILPPVNEMLRKNQPWKVCSGHSRERSN